MIDQNLMAIGYSNGTLNLWVCCVSEKIKNNSRYSEGQ